MTQYRQDDLSLALEVLIPEARKAIPASAAMEVSGESQRLRGAVDAVEDFVSNNVDEIEDFFQKRGGLESLRPGPGEPVPEIDMGSIADMADDPQTDQWATFFHLVCQRFYRESGLEDDTPLSVDDPEGDYAHTEIAAGYAANLAGNFWLHHGPDLLNETVRLDIGDLS